MILTKAPNSPVLGRVIGYRSMMFGLRMQSENIVPRYPAGTIVAEERARPWGKRKTGRRTAANIFADSRVQKVLARDDGRVSLVNPSKLFTLGHDKVLTDSFSVRWSLSLLSDGP